MTRKTTMEPTRTFADMIDEGWLTPVSFYVPEVSLTSSLWPEAIAQYQKHAAGKKALVFCVSQQQVAEALACFLDAGIAAASLIADDGPAKRTAALKGFASGTYQVLISVTVALGLGNDPSIQVIIMAAPTGSKTRYEMMVASAMRPQYAEGMTPAEAAHRRASIAVSGKPQAIILDFAGNCLRLGVDSFSRRSPKPATHLTIPGSLEWDQAPVVAAPADMTAAVDAAMVAMAGIFPPLRRSECERLIRAAFAAAPTELAALREELTSANEKIDLAWNRSHALDHQGFIPGALDAWKRPVKQHLPYDFSGNPGESAIQYCNGWNDSGGYWSGHAADLQQSLKAAEQRNAELVELLRKVQPCVSTYANGTKSTLRAEIDAALKPTESGASE